MWSERVSNRSSEMKHHSGSMEVITPIYISRMLNVPLAEVEEAKKNLGL